MSDKVEIDTSAITNYIADLDKKVFTIQDLHDIFKSKEDNWLLPMNWQGRDFIEFILSEKLVLKKQLNSETSRYLFDEPSVFEIAIETYPNSYFSHYTAMQFHGLTEQLPKSIYVTYEQIIPTTEKTNISLEQGAIDKAFREGKHRTIKSKTTIHENRTIYWHHKKTTESFGIIEKPVFSNKLVCITNLERTLMDIVMRPLYSGGVYEIFQAFANAASDVSINKLCSYLKKTDAIYPYHQCIGFYMEKTGLYTDKQISMLKQFEQTYDFYLTYAIKDFDYSEKWKLFYPKGF